MGKPRGDGGIRKYETVVSKHNGVLQYRIPADSLAKAIKIKAIEEFSIRYDHGSLEAIGATVEIYSRVVGSWELVDVSKTK